MINQENSLVASANVEKNYRNTLFIITTLIVVTFLLSAIIAFILVRHITVPVKQLAVAAEKVADGDFNIQLEILSYDEVGNLTQSFNQMANSLQSAGVKIQKQQDELQASNNELSNKTILLEKQKLEIEEKNVGLEEALKELKETQHQLVMKEKMASLGNLVAGVAHEINNPIGAVYSAADTSVRSLNMVLDTLESSGNLTEIKNDKNFSCALDILKKNNTVMLIASERIAKIVKSLKNFARLDESEFQKADLHEGLDSTLTLLEHELKNRIEVNKHYGTIPELACYPNQLNQVFMNIMANAIQSIHEKGTITISTGTENGNIVIKIHDNGVGIDEKHIGQIFDPGFTTKGVGVGTGLGLSISYNIIKKHNGEIKVESELNKGTAFNIILPCA